MSEHDELWESERDELWELVNLAGNVETDHSEIDRATDAILAAGYRKPRTITTAEELDALGLGAIVRDGSGDTWELTDNDWRCWAYEDSFQSLELCFPATVLYEPPA